LLGDTGNDFLSGEDGNDTLYGVLLTSTNPGSGERDTLLGGAGNDVFVLGHRNHANSFYIGNNGNDYALIRDFNATQDKIQLKGSASNYTLRVENLGLGTYGTNDAGLYYTANSSNDLVAKVQDGAGLNLASNAFIYL